MFNFLKKWLGAPADEDLSQLIKDGAYLVDVRTPAEFQEGHVRGSVNIPLDQVTAQVAQFKNKKHVIVFCRSGNRSSQAKSVLAQHGITNVTNGLTWRNVAQFVN